MAEIKSDTVQLHGINHLVAVKRGGDIYNMKYSIRPVTYGSNGITSEELNATLLMFEQFTLTDEAKRLLRIKIDPYVSISDENYVN